MTAVEKWRRDLEAWALPQRLLETVDESPYGWPAHLFQRMSRFETGPSPTVTAAHELAGPGGTIIDVGAGTGRVGLALAQLGHPVTCVERSERMLEGLRADAAESGVDVAVVEGSWPDVDLPTVDVAVCANVVYDVADIGPFVSALTVVGRSGVVIEATPTHPWAHLTPYYRALHGLDRPSGPTVEDLAAAVLEITGSAPRVERWVQPATMRFADVQELLEVMGRRLVMPESRWSDLMDVLEPDLCETDGWITLGAPIRDMAMVVVV